MQRLHLQGTIFGDVKHFKHRFFARTEQLPGNDVGMVLGHRDQDFIAFVHKGLPETVGHQVDGRRGAGGENNLFAGRGVQEGAHRIPGLFIGICCLNRQRVHRPVNVGILQRGQFLLSLQNGLGPLRGGRIIQINQGLAIHPDSQGRE